MTSLSPTEASPIVCDVALSVQHISRRLQTEFQEMDPDALTTLVQEALDRTRDARVQQFRELLAERHVREDLRRIVVHQHSGSRPG